MKNNTIEVRDFIQEFIPKMDSTDKVYQLFANLNYPQENILDSSYRRDIAQFDFAKEEEGKKRGR